MGDESSIGTACSITIQNIKDLSENVRTIALLIRDARADMLELISELASLSLSIAMLQDDCEKLPYPDNVLPDLSTNFRHVLEKCDDATHEMSLLIESCTFSSSSSGFQWAVSGQDGMNKLRTNFESCKRAIAFALMVGQMVLLKNTEERGLASHGHMVADDHNNHEIPAVGDVLPAIHISEIPVPVSFKPRIESNATMREYLDEMNTIAENGTDMNGTEPVNPEHLEDLMQKKSIESSASHESLLPSTPHQISPNQSRLSSSPPPSDRKDSYVSLTEDSVLEVVNHIETAVIEPQTADRDPKSVKEQLTTQNYDETNDPSALDHASQSLELPQVVGESIGSDLALHRELSRGPHSRQPLSQDHDIGQRSTTWHLEGHPDLSEATRASLSIGYAEAPTPIATSEPGLIKEGSIKTLNDLLVEKIQAPLSEDYKTRQKQKTEIRKLIDDGAGPNLLPVSTPFGVLAGLDAALLLEVHEHARFDVVNHLLLKGARADTNPAILQEAIYTWSIKVVKLLMAKGAQLPSSYDSTVQARFSTARSSQKSSDTVQFVLAAGADPDFSLGNDLPGNFSSIALASDSSEHPLNRPDLASLYIKLTGPRQDMLCHASAQNQADVVDILINHGVKVSRTALNVAGFCGSVPTIYSLLKHITSPAQYLMIPSSIYCAAATGQPDVVRILVDFGGDVNGHLDIEDTGIFTGKKSPLLLAISMGQATAAHILVVSGAKIFPQDFIAALQDALNVQDKAKSRELVALVIRVGGPEAQNIGHELCKAVESGNAALTGALLRIGDADAKDSNGDVLCIQAARENHVEVLRTILGHKPKKSSTALRAAARRGHIEIIKMLLDYGVGIDLTDTTGDAALHRACVALQSEAVQFLLDKGAKVDVKSKQGTPLKVTQAKLQLLHKDVAPIADIRRCESIIATLKKAEYLKPKKRGFFR